MSRVVPPDAGAAGDARGGMGASDLFLRILFTSIAHGHVVAALEEVFQVVGVAIAAPDGDFGYGERRVGQESADLLEPLFNYRFLQRSDACRPVCGIAIVTLRFCSFGVATQLRNICFSKYAMSAFDASAAAMV